MKSGDKNAHTVARSGQLSGRSLLSHTPVPDGHPARQAATAVFVPVGDLFDATCACSVGAACEGSGAGERRVPPEGRRVLERLMSFRVADAIK